MIGIIGAMDTEVKTLVANIQDAKITEYGGLKYYQGKLKGKDVVVRKLMPVECLRLMGFEDFKIKVEDNVAYRQAGNSIAVPVLKALIREIMKQFFNREV